MSIKDEFYVDRILFSDCKEWLLYKHYAHRIPSISYAFGLFENGILKGVCTFGTPPVNNQRIGICGELFSEYVIELNRLVVESDKKNITSFFVSQCLKKIDKPKIIISYADTSFNHNGYIYQATNFIYVGLSAVRTDWKIEGKESLHNQTISDMARGKENRREWIENNIGKIELEDRARKHRYIYFIGSKREKKQFLKALKYKIEPYPKGQNKNYDASYKPIIQGRLF